MPRQTQQKLDQLREKFQQRQAKLENNNQYVEAAVFIPLVQTPQGLSLLFEVRAATLSWQPGQICFPGGKADLSDPSKVHTAVRETQEELGLSATDLTVYGELDYFVSPIGLLIYPVCGEILNPANISPNPHEVASVFTVPLQWFIDNPPQISSVQVATKAADDFPFHLIPSKHKDEWRVRSQYDVLFYHYQDKVIWGLTAQIVYSFLLTLNWLKA